MAAKGWTERDLRPIGFFASRRRRTPFESGGQEFTIDGVELIASVSSCLAEWPAGWIDRWLHNELWLFDSLEILESIVPDVTRDEFTRYAVAALAVQFDDGEAQPLPTTSMNASAAPPEFVRLGYDVCSRSLGTSFECSPATCSGLAAELGANAYGLFDSLPRAVEVARSRQPGIDEPGPYAVLEIRAESDPLA